MLEWSEDSKLFVWDDYCIFLILKLSFISSFLVVLCTLIYCKHIFPYLTEHTFIAALIFFFYSNICVILELDPNNSLRGGLIFLFFWLFICWAICIVSWILWILYCGVSELWYTLWKVKIFYLFMKHFTWWTWTVKSVSWYSAKIAIYFILSWVALLCDLHMHT